MIKNIYHYGEILTIVPKMGLDLIDGKIIITGVIDPNLVPKFVDQDSWKTEDLNYNQDLLSQPWYFFQYTDGSYSGETFGLPAVIFNKVVKK